MPLSVDPLALTNVQLLVADDELEGDDLIICQPVLVFGIDARTMLEQKK